MMQMTLLSKLETSLQLPTEVLRIAINPDSHYAGLWKWTKEEEGAAKLPFFSLLKLNFCDNISTVLPVLMIQFLWAVSKLLYIPCRELTKEDKFVKVFIYFC